MWIPGIPLNAWILKSLFFLNITDHDSFHTEKEVTKNALAWGYSSVVQQLSYICEGLCSTSSTKSFKKRGSQAVKYGAQNLPQITAYLQFEVSMIKQLISQPKPHLANNQLTLNKLESSLAAYFENTFPQFLIKWT